MKFSIRQNPGFLTALAAGLSAVSVSAVSVSADEKSLVQQMEQLAAPYVESDRVVGLSVGVLKDGESTSVHLGRTGEDGKQPNDDPVCRKSMTKCRGSHQKSGSGTGRSLPRLLRERAINSRRGR